MSRFHLLPDPQGDGQVFGDALRRVVDQFGYEALVACDDPTLARLSWLGWSHPTVPATGPPFVALTDKLILSELAARAGVDYPLTFEASTPGAISTALDTAGLPVVVKASRSATAFADRVLYSKGAIVAYDRRAAEEAASSFTAQGFLPIVQQRVFTTTKLNSIIVRRSGSSELRYAHRVLREIPSSGGMGITLQTVAPDDSDAAAAIGALERVCDEAGYEGLAQAEFYVDRESSRTWLLDVNPRPWGSTWFVEKLGMRVVECAVWAALGEPATQQGPYPAGRRFRHTTSELKWFRQERSLLRSLLGLVRDTRPGDVYEYVDVSDLGPFVRHAVARVTNRSSTSRPFQPS